jgi:hypothetical protein
MQLAEVSPTFTLLNGLIGDGSVIQPIDRHCGDTNVPSEAGQTAAAGDASQDSGRAR